MKSFTALSCAVIFSAMLGSGIAKAAGSDIQASLKDHVKYLASEELAGRAPGTEGNKKAAQYIEKNFRAAGLRPFKQYGFMQEFPVITDVEVLKMGNACSIGSVQSVYGQDYTPLGFSDNGQVKARLVFAGYGISIPGGHDDYAGIDVKNAIVAVIRGVPDTANPHGQMMQYAGLRIKAMTAREKGAAGIIYISAGDPAKPDTLLSPRLEHGGKVEGMIALHIRRGIIAPMLGWTKAENLPAKGEIKGLQVACSAALQYTTVNTANVIGYVPGTDPAKTGEFVVCGAHFDHLGLGGEGSGSLSGSVQPQIHYGADDNASGTAGLMELARLIAARPLTRPVLFMAFSAEERGLLGSAHFVKHPWVGTDSIAFMLNMDMIGRMKDNKLNVQGVGTSAEFQKIIDSLGTAMGLSLSTSADGMGPSDHSSFYGKECPVLFFFTGLHSDYHRPTDTWDKINYEGQEKVVYMAEAAVRRIGNAAARPGFIKVKSAATQGQSMGFRVSLGITPDYSDHPKGMRITAVREGGAAEKAGLQADDILVLLGETPVKNVYDYTYALGKYKAGDKAIVKVLRGPREDKEVSLEVIFEGRK
jgi:hypothetical protein